MLKNRHSFCTKYTLIIITLLFFLSGWQYLLLEKELSDVKYSIKKIEDEYKDIEWQMIEDILTHSTLQAQLNVRRTSERIVSDIYEKYPNINQLKQIFDNDPEIFDYQFGTTLLDNIKDGYIYNIRNQRNETFIMNKDGIVASYRLSSKYTSIRGKWETDLESVYNVPLCKDAIEKIIAQESSLIFWEKEFPTTDNHIMLNTSSKYQLRDVFYKEGLEGIQGYTFLAPYYITAYGDMFGIPDYDPVTGNKNHNYKLIVVQKYNLYDIIQNFHKNEFLELREVKSNTIEAYENIIKTRTWYAMLTTFIQILVIILAISINRNLTNRDDNK